MDNFINLLPIIAILAFSGIFAGFLAGLLGVGGGIIFVPVYYFVFLHFFNISTDTAILLATSTSLATMIPTSASSCIFHFKKDNIDKTLLLKWLPFLLLGVILGRFLSAKFGGEWLTILFGCILIFSACNMLFFAKKKSLFGELPNNPIQYCIATVISSISVMLGIGGGTLTVPTLSLFNYDTKKAIGTAATIGLIICLPGAITTIISDVINNYSIPNTPFLTLGHICFLAVICIIPFSMLTAPIGVKINKHLSPIVIKRIYAILLFCTSAKMLSSVF
ncbi:MAG: sulfite exporter TauE/SafE family protein [Succinivibrionaceae bacterium]